MSKKKKKNVEENLDIKKWMVILVSLFISLVSLFKFGVIGVSLYNFFSWLFGRMGVVFQVQCFILMFYSLIERKSHFKGYPVLSQIFFLLAGILFFSLVQKDVVIDATLINKSFFEYSSMLSESFKPSFHGGVIGSIIVVACQYLFAKEGTYLLMVILLCISIVLLMLYKPLKVSLERLRNVFSIPVNDEVEEPIVKEKEKKASFITFNDNQNKEVKRQEESRVDSKTLKVKEEKNTLIKPTKEELSPVFIESYNHNSEGVVYQLPPISLLDSVEVKASNAVNEEAAKAKAQRLLEVLAQFQIESELIAIHIGPSVTQFEIKPDSNVKVNRIMGIYNNIKMELSARDLRIEAPIPGRNAIGIEIPNVESTSVKMLELVKGIKPQDLSKRLMLALGKDLHGQYVYCELNKMPHLLIAGATGSGKSVCMNSIIISILLRTAPSEVKLLLIDPKKVEFTPYLKIPHLIGPVITDATEANRALKVIIAIMDERYGLMKEFDVKNIASYNEAIKKNKDEKLQPMPYIVVVIDELADLMMVAGKEVEASIIRITQLARAAGIHLVVATQRPSADVITGLIKANIPSRIAFNVASGIDSRTILDSVGAERLLGNGDMLYSPMGSSGMTRLQGAYVTDEEIARITQFCSKQATPMYEDAFIILEGVDNNEATSMVKAEDDPMYDEIKAYVIESQKASTSLLQRRFGIGYNRAARLIDVLESRGIVGPVQGSKPREVYIKRDNND